MENRFTANCFDGRFGMVKPQDKLLDKSDENLKSAELLARNEYYNAAMNCLYSSVYLKVYRKMIYLDLDSESNKLEKHKKALDYLFEESRKSNPDASVAHMLLSRLKTDRVKASYSFVHILPGEYMSSREYYTKNKIPFERFILDVPGGTDETEVDENEY